MQKLKHICLNIHCQFNARKQSTRDCTDQVDTCGRDIPISKTLNKAI